MSSRRTLGTLVATTGVVAGAASMSLPWLSSQWAPALPITYLVQALPEPAAEPSYWTSVAAPLTVLGGIGLLGVVLRSRVLLGVAWLVGVGTVGLWVVMRAIGAGASGSSTVLDLGPLVCGVGMLVLLAGIAIMEPRHEEIEAPLSVFDDRRA